MADAPESINHHNALVADEKGRDLYADEKGQAVYSNDVNSSQGSAPADLDEYPDPDIGKTDEERAKLVCAPTRCWPRLGLTHARTKPWYGRWTSG